VAKNGFMLQYSMRIGCRYQAVRIPSAFMHQGESVDRSQPLSIVGESTHDGTKLVPDEEVLAGDDGNRHLQVFVDNVRNRTQPEDDLEVGHYATNVGHLMNVAYEVGRKIRGTATGNTSSMTPKRMPSYIAPIEHPGNWRCSRPLANA